MAHAQALRMTALEILEESRNQPDGDELDLNFSKEMGIEEESGLFTAKFPQETLSSIGQTKRLACFTAVATEECHLVNQQ
jgi:hypothetical protein